MAQDVPKIFRFAEPSTTLKSTVTADVGPTMSDKNPVVPSRTFTSPSGRRWTASLAAAPVRNGTAVVLRFTSGEVVFDLEEWPADWETFPDADLVLLLRGAKLPRLGLPIPDDEPQKTGGR